MEELKLALGLNFVNERLLQTAFVHRSFLNEHPDRLNGLGSNERLEFLGDAVLSFLVTDWLYARFPEHSEGDLTEMRQELVKASTLARFAQKLNLGRYVRIIRGQDSPEARNRPALLADLFEALLGAIYLDQGVEAARTFVIPFLEREIEAIRAGRSDDFRTRLQQKIQARYGITPTYRTVAVQGPPHNSEFTVEVLLGDQRIGIGQGRSKQAAAQAAARAALEADAATQT